MAASLLPELTVLTLNTIIITLDHLRGGISERALLPQEREYLSTIFGQNLNYDDMTIVTGGFKQQLGVRAHVVGNQIFMPKRFDDGTPILTTENTLTTAGLELLGHEAAHVWQYQHEGTGYITDSVIRQLYDGQKDTYNWHQAVGNGTAFVDMNVERQAEIAALIGMAIAHQLEQGLAPVLTLEALNEVIDDDRHHVNAEQFLIFEQAFRKLRQ